jgi:hypothetical protein
MHAGCHFERWRSDYNDIGRTQSISIVRLLGKGEIMNENSVSLQSPEVPCSRAAVT